MMTQQTLLSYLQSFTGFDWFLMGLLVLSVIISVVRGAFKELITTSTWVLAIVVAMQCNPWLATKMAPYIASGPLRSVLAVVSLAIGVLLLGALFNAFMARLVKQTGLSGMDRFLGIVFGAVRGVALVGVVLMGGQVLHFNDTPWWHKAQTVQYYQPLLAWAQKDGREALTAWYHRYVVPVPKENKSQRLTRYVEDEIQQAKWSFNGAKKRIKKRMTSLHVQDDDAGTSLVDHDVN